MCGYCKKWSYVQRNKAAMLEAVESFSQLLKGTSRGPEAL